MTNIRLLPEPPRFEVRPPPLPDGNATIVSIAGGQSINTAITARAGVGNVIFELQAGATFTELIRLTSFNGPVLFRKSGAPQTQRWASPATSVANGLPVVLSPAGTPGKCVYYVGTSPGLNAITFQDIDFQTPAGTVSGGAQMIEVDDDPSGGGWPTNGNGYYATKASRLLSSQIGLVRCLVRSTADSDVKVGVSLGGRMSYLKGCWIQDFHFVGGNVDSTTFRLYSGTGGWLVEDCVMAAVNGEVVQLCGAAAEMQDLIPSDGIFRRCHFYTPRSYWDAAAPVKSIVESKSSRRVLMDSCIFDYVYESAQQGASLMLWGADGGPPLPWTQTTDWEIRNCWFKTVPILAEIAGRYWDTVHVQANPQQNRFYLNNCLATGWGAVRTGPPAGSGPTSQGRAFFVAGDGNNLNAGDIHGITIDHTTVVNAQGDNVGSLLALDGGGNGWATSQWTRLRIRRNAWAGGSSLSDINWAALNAATGTNEYAQNVFGGTNGGSNLPPNNTKLANIAAMKFVDATVFAATNPHYDDLDRAKYASDSPCKVANGYVSDDGKDAGCDIDALKVALSGVEATVADGLPA